MEVIALPLRSSKKWSPRFFHFSHIMAQWRVLGAVYGISGDGILMEYVDGETLSQRLSRDPDYFRNRSNSDRFVSQLLDAVGYLHSHQILHLDLKPDNILLIRINDDVKFIDLGCCRTDT